MKKLSTKGFGLIEALIATALLGGVALGFMKLTENMSRGQVTSETKMEGLEMKRLISTTLLDKAACDATFTGKAIGANITEIKNSSGIPVYEINKPYGGNMIKINSMVTRDLNQVGSDGTRKVELIIDLEKIRTQSYSQVKDAIIQLFVVADSPTGIIMGCISDSQKMLEANCESLGGTWTGIACDLENYVKKIGDTMTGKLTLPELVSTGPIKIGGGGSCSAAQEGSQRYNSGIKQMEFCNGVAWGALGGGGISETVVVTGPTSPCRGASAVTCPSGYKMTGGGHEFAGSCGCGEEHRFPVYSKPNGNGWISTVECAYNRAFAVCVK